MTVVTPNRAGNPFAETVEAATDEERRQRWTAVLSDLNACSQKGLVEMFDGSIGAGSVLMPYGGKSTIARPRQFSTRRGSFVTTATGVASRFSSFAKARKASSSFLSTTTAIRSWDSDMAISVPSRPAYFLGTRSRFTRSPAASSPMATELPQKKLVRGAASGYSSYGNQIGLATGYVKEIYHPDYVAKRMEIGAGGLTLDEIPCGKYGTLDQYVPGGDYIVIKFARWAFEKFKGAEDKLGTQMRAVGEVMSIGKTYKEAFQKAIRSLENGKYGLGFVKDFAKKSKLDLLKMLAVPTSERQFIMYEALRKGATVEELFERTKIKHYFIEQMKELVEEEEGLLRGKGSVPQKEALRQAKLDGFSDKYLSEILEVPECEIRKARMEAGIQEAWEGVHVSSTKDSAYYFSSYHIQDESTVCTDRPKIMILGGGPNRIGQGIEFDYCCVHAALALKKLGFETIIVNCNPETVSTDYDTSDKLYFEPLTLEDVLSIHEKEKPVGVIAQFGGQTPLNLAADLKKNGVNILGTTPETIDMAEDRDLFRAMMDKLNIPMPQAGMAVDTKEALSIANKIGYPVMVRPSYVLGGRGMEVVHDDESLIFYMRAAVGVTPDRPILIDRFLQHATECEADAISDGEHVFVPAVMEHIELAGVHSGDSACILPSKHLSKEHIETIKEYTRKIAQEMNVVGLMNMQYAIEDGTIYVLEANPRASRTVPLVSKVCGINMVKLATEIMTTKITGNPSPVPGLHDREIPYYGVKEAVFPFNMFQEVDPLLGPEMRSTGEVLGLSGSYGKAFYKAQEATQTKLPMEGTVLFSVNDRDKPELVETARELYECGFGIMATGSTCDKIREAGMKAEKIAKINEGRPNILDAIANGQIDLIINTPNDKKGSVDDSYIRKAAIKNRIPYMTTMAAAKATAAGIRSMKNGEGQPVKSLQEYHGSIKG